jgi:AraC-like DNA-binding protein
MPHNPVIQVASTGPLSGARRFQYWADVVAQTFVPLECDAPDRGNFFGDVRHRQIGLVGITDVRASAMRVRRTPATIARAPSDDLIVVLHLDGACHAGQKSASAKLLPGDGAVVATDECYFFEFPDRFRQLVLKLPRCLLAQERTRRDRQRALVLASGSARLLQRLALSALEDSVALCAEEEVGIERAFADVLGAAVRSPDAGHDSGQASPQYAAACLFIRRRLTDPALNPRTVAAHVKMSTRSLARLFARNGATVERAIWTERLNGAQRDLLDPRLLDRSITDIAFSWGYGDAAHFSRAFSGAFGLAPSAFRAANVTALPWRRRR